VLQNDANCHVLNVAAVMSECGRLMPIVMFSVLLQSRLIGIFSNDAQVIAQATKVLPIIALLMVSAVELVVGVLATHSVGCLLVTTQLTQLACVAKHLQFMSVSCKLNFLVCRRCLSRRSARLVCCGRWHLRLGVNILCRV
jgi:hypothetical protein